MSFSFVRLLPYMLALTLAVGAFFYGVKVGKQGERVVIQERIIQAGERHADTEQRQANHVSTRGMRLHINGLQSGSF